MFADTDTPLGRLIDRQIAETGPMPFSLYMQLCLTHPEHGYYHRPNPIGRTGDFITAPEVSQMFGEAIGVFVALLARQFPGPDFDLVELGPGRGTLMADLWRSLGRAAPDLRPGPPVLLEIGAALRAEQSRRLSALAPRFIEAVEQLPEHGPPLVILANEFFDALPLRQYQKTESGWHERMIGLDKGRRVWGLNPTPIPDSALPAALHGAETNARFESRTAAEAVMAVLADRLLRRHGALLVVDYGYTSRRTGDTIQAMIDHAYADPLLRPGEVDLTAHVDFEVLAGSAGALERFQVLDQGPFLAALGIAERAQMLAAAHPSRAGAIAADLARLTDRAAMGTLFKAMCLASPGLDPYPFVPGA